MERGSLYSMGYAHTTLAKCGWAVAGSKTVAVGPVCLLLGSWYFTAVIFCWPGLYWPLLSTDLYLYCRYTVLYCPLAGPGLLYWCWSFYCSSTFVLYCGDRCFYWSTYFGCCFRCFCWSTYLMLLRCFYWSNTFVVYCRCFCCFGCFYCKWRWSGFYSNGQVDGAQHTSAYDGTSSLGVCCCRRKGPLRGNTG